MKFKFQIFLFLMAAASSVQLFAQTASTKAKQPNIILILADDLGYGDLACYGATKVQTPNVDRLAEEGIRFTDAHTPSAVCSPTRYSLLTGLYPWRYAPLKKGVLNWSKLSIGTEQLNLASMLKEQGYTTAAVGKWHLGLGDENWTSGKVEDWATAHADNINWNGIIQPGPLEIGFDYFFGIPTVNSLGPRFFMENHRVYNLEPYDPITKLTPFSMEGGESTKYLHGHIDQKHLEKALDWLNHRDEKPFFLYFATASIHTPLFPNPRFFQTSGAGIYGDFIQEHDWLVGQIMSWLKQTGRQENTLVIYSSDNGGANIYGSSGYPGYRKTPDITISRMYGHNPNGDLRGQKSDIWEGGHRVPLIIRWPDKISAGRISHSLVGLNDVLATVMDILDFKKLDSISLDSKSMLPILLNDDNDMGRRFLVTASFNGMHALRDGAWKYIEGQGSGGITSGKGNWQGGGYQPEPDEPPGQLYNLQNDPGEQNNLYNEHPEIVKRLKKKLLEIEGKDK